MVNDGWPLFISCAPGLEPLLAAEVQRLLGESASPTVEPGGVSLGGDARTVMVLNLGSGVATHVLRRVATFSARHFSTLAKQAARVPWPEHIGEDTRWRVRASSSRSKLYHTDAIAQRVNDAIARALGRPSSETDREVTIVARLQRDTCTLSIDTSGAPLHRRGWRRQTGKAPLREDLAHALLLASTWDRTTPLIDPFVGSGTIAIEAATMALGLAPGRLRRFAFEHAPWMDAELWRRVRAEATPQPRSAPLIVGRDRVQGALQATAGNATRAGVEAALAVQRADLRKQPLAEARGAVVVTNPPYGHRIADARPALAALAARCAADGVATVALVLPEAMPISLPGFALRTALMTDSGGTKVSFRIGHANPDEHGPPEPS